MNKLRKLETDGYPNNLILTVSEDVIEFLNTFGTVQHDYPSSEGNEPAEITYIIDKRRYIDRGPYEPLKENLNKVQQAIRDLRDSESHMCPVDHAQKNDVPDADLECTCGGYDAVIDDISKIIKEYGKTT